ncbi:MAG: hypothetical protein IJU70_08310 [Lentisphaeria bacterium]|nr:hypothetical protein [Lentisphaeria bacterium]
MLYFDEDSDARFYMPEAGTMTADVLDAMLANLAQTRIGCLIVGVNAQKSNFRSRFVESYLDRFDAAGGLLQSAMRGSRDVWRYRRCANLAALEAQGVDSNAYLLAGARKLGRQAWIDVRMNDMHDGHDENSAIHSELWRRHPELRIPGNIPCGNGYDYSHACIRKMYADYVEEADGKYRPDNVLLDWMRWPAYFPKGTGRENAPLVTEFLRDVCSRLGRPAACRVPIAPETALDLGMDVKAWVREGLISHLFVGNFGVAPDFDVPVERWREIVGDLPVIVSLYNAWSAGLDRSSSHGEFTVEEARGLAAAAYFRGADGIQLFNCFRYLRGDTPAELVGKGVDPEKQRENQRIGRRLFNELHDPETLYALPRRVHPGWDDTLVHIGDLDRSFRIPGYLADWRKTHSDPEGTLPRTSPALWKLWTAKVPAAGAVLVTDAQGPVKVNGHEVSGSSPYRIPREWLSDGVTTVETAGPVSKLYIDL